jgi:hypothetical protein
VATLSEIVEIREHDWQCNKIGRLESNLSQFPFTESAESQLCSPDKPAVVSTSTLLSRVANDTTRSWDD